MKFGKFLGNVLDIVLNYGGYTLFIIAGFVSAVTSALIEYKVVSGLVTKLGENFSMVAALVVFAAETTKVVSVYLHKRLTDSRNREYLNGNVYNHLRFILVTLSMACTLIYLFSGLNNPNYEYEVSRVVSEADADYKRRLENINADYNQRLEGCGTEVESWRRQLESEAQDVQNGIAIGGSFMALDSLYSNALDDQRNVRSQLERERANKIDELEHRHERNIAEAKERLRTDSASHHRMISAFLQVLHGGPHYPHSHYMAFIGIFSVLVCIMLECVIVYVFQILAVEHGDME